jgi:thiamine kinase-like enzyme
MAISQPSVGRDSAAVAKEATNAVAIELAKCAAYYTIAAAAIDVSFAPEAERELRVVQTKQAAVAALRASEQLTSTRVAAAQMDLAWETMIRQMDRKWENFAIVAEKYMSSCKDRIEAPDVRFVYWMVEKANPPDLSQR